MILQMEKKSFERMLSTRSVISKYKKIDLDSLQLAIESFGETVWETRIENGIGYIPVQGVLLPKRSWVMDFFEDSHTSYADIMSSLDEFETDPQVKSVTLEINSPGGYTDGLDQVVSRLQNYTKNVVTLVNGMCCSAAYHIAVATSEIVARNKGDLIGSIGTMVEGYDLSKWEELVGIKSVVVTNRTSTEKVADFSTEDGLEVLRDELDDMQEIFEEDIVAGRSQNQLFSIEKVRDLKGRVLTAKKAVSIGLVDTVGVSGNLEVENNETEYKPGEEEIPLKSEGEPMDLKQFLAENPDAQKEFDAEISASYDSGVEGERARVAEMLDIGSVQMTETLKTALQTGQDAGAYAKAQLKAHSVRPKMQTPKAVTPSAQKEAVETEQSDAEILRAHMKKARGK